MSQGQIYTGQKFFRLLLGLSVVSCLAFPRGLDGPRRLLSPLLGPLSRSGTYLSDALKYNVRDLMAGDCDAQTLREILQANPALRDVLYEQSNKDQLRRLGAYELWMGEYRRQVSQLSQARQALGDDFPCMLIPARVIGASASPFAKSHMLSTDSRATDGSMVTTRELMTGRPTALPERLAALVGSMLVGRVQQSGAWTARLLLLTDPEFRIQGAVVRMVTPGIDRQVTVFEPDGPNGRAVPVRRPLVVGDPPIYINLQGDGTGLVSAETPAYHEIIPGDHVFTLGDDPLLPMGVEIGVVSKTEVVGENPKHVYIHVKPSVDINSLRNVQIVAPLAGRGATVR